MKHLTPGMETFGRLFGAMRSRSAPASVPATATVTIGDPMNVTHQAPAPAGAVAVTPAVTASPVAVTPAATIAAPAATPALAAPAGPVVAGGPIVLTEAQMREQLAAEADARVTGAAPVGETPEAMATRLRAEAAEITDLCAIAGKPKAAAGFIRAGKTPGQVRAELVNRDAGASARQPVVPVDTQAMTQESENAVAASWDTISAKANAMAGFTNKRK